MPLATLSVRTNLFAYEASVASLELLQQRCKQGELLCDGLPPRSCTAFGTGFMVQARNPDKCEECGPPWVSGVLLAVGSVVAIGAMAAYVWLVNRHTVSQRIRRQRIRRQPVRRQRIRRQQPAEALINRHRPSPTLKYIPSSRSGGSVPMCYPAASVPMR